MLNATITGYKKRALTAAALAANGVSLVHLPMHGIAPYGDDTASTIRDRSPTPVLGGDLSPAGTLTNMFSNNGWWTPTSTSYVRIKTQAAVDLFDAVNSKAIIVALNIYHTGDPASECSLIEAGSNNAATNGGGGFGVRLKTDGNLGTVSRARDTGSSMTGAAQKDITAHTGARKTYLACVDVEASVVKSYYQGAFHVSDALVGNIFQPSAAFGVSIGCRATDASTQANFAGAGANGLRLSNVWIMRDTTGVLLADVANIAADLYETPNGIPRSLMRALGIR